MSTLSEPTLSLSADGVTYSVTFDRWDAGQSDRAQWQYSIVVGDDELTCGSDLTSVGEPVLAEALASLLTFLSAACESYRYAGIDGENARLFPESLVSALDADDVTMLAEYVRGGSE